MGTKVTPSLAHSRAVSRNMRFGSFVVCRSCEARARRESQKFMAMGRGDGKIESMRAAFGEARQKHISWPTTMLRRLLCVGDQQMTRLGKCRNAGTITEMCEEISQHVVPASPVPPAIAQNSVIALDVKRCTTMRAEVAGWHNVDAEAALELDQELVRAHCQAQNLRRNGAQKITRPSRHL